jgi:membrane associated rhomboid family serine protease
MGRVNTILIAANAAVFLLQGMADDRLLLDWALWPIGDYAYVEARRIVGFHAWQLLTSAFLHGDLAHLVLNMFPLYMFGRDLERVLGSRRYLALYGAAVLTASLTQLAVVTVSGDVYPTVGASGGVFGVLLAFGMLFPERTVVLLFPPIPLPARTFVILYGLLELVHGVMGTAAGVAHFAHLGGMLGAWLVLLGWRGRARRARRG